MVRDMQGYIVGGEDNGSYAFREPAAVREDSYWYEANQTLVPNRAGRSRSGVRRCVGCGELMDKWSEQLAGLRIKRRQFDISGTYDGVLVVSRKFKQVYDSASLTGLRYIQLPDGPSFYQVQATDVVAFDAEKRNSLLKSMSSMWSLRRGDWRDASLPKVRIHDSYPRICENRSGIWQR